MHARPVEPGYAVVAVDGSEEGYAAVVFAAKEARRYGHALRLAHVMPAWVPVGPLLMIATDEGLGAFASETLASAFRAATDAVPELQVSTHVLLGNRVAEVVRLAERAAFVVVGRRPSSALDRCWSGGTLDGIVSRSRCPVFVVPRTSARADRPARVVAAFKSADHSAGLFEASFRAAHELGAELEVIHAWRLDGGYDDIIASRVSEGTWDVDQTAAIHRALARWQMSYPDVPVRIEVVHEYPARALLEAARGADRLVLVKPRHGRLAHHLGSTARGVLRFAECPVEVVPAMASDEPSMFSAAIRPEGELLR